MSEAVALPDRESLVVLPAGRPLHVVARRNPFDFATTRLEVPAGATIAQLILEAGLDPT